MINITGIDLKKFVKKVYELSSPQGMGFLHARQGELSDEDAQKILDAGSERFPLDMDYVHGRACKMHARKQEDGSLVIPDSWYDHSDETYDQLLAEFNIQRPVAEQTA